MDKRVHKILCILTMVIFALIFIQEKTKMIPIKNLGGVVDEVAWPRITMRDYCDRSYQNNLEEYSKQNFGFRQWFIKCYNQYLWDFYGKTNAISVSVGKDNWLYELWFVEEYYHSRMHKYTDDPQEMKEKLKLEAVRLYKVQEILKDFNVNLFVMMEPGKERVFPEYLPDENQDIETDVVKAIDYFAYLFDSLGVNHVNFSKYFVEQKGNVDYPLFPQTGTHWSNIAAVYSADSLLRYMESIGNKNLNKLKIGEPYYDKTRKPDDDLEKMLNLVREIPKAPNMYVDVSVIEDTSSIKPKLITIGDSFFWNFINQIPLDSIFTGWQYWYYNSTIYYNSKYNSTSELDLVSELTSTDYVMLSYCTSMIYDLGNGFLTKALVQLCYSDKEIESVINSIVANMKNDKNWYSSLEAKAKDRGMELEDVMRGDALYLVYLNPERYFAEINTDSVPSKRNEDIYIKQIKNKIYSYPTWLNEVKRKAGEWNVSLDSAVTRDAIWYYNQHKQNNR